MLTVTINSIVLSLTEPDNNEKTSFPTVRMYEVDSSRKPMDCIDKDVNGLFHSFFVGILNFLGLFLFLPFRSQEHTRSSFVTNLVTSVSIIQMSLHQC